VGGVNDQTMVQHLTLCRDWGCTLVELRLLMDLLAMAVPDHTNQEHKNQPAKHVVLAHFVIEEKKADKPPPPTGLTPTAVTPRAAPTPGSPTPPTPSPPLEFAFPGEGARRLRLTPPPPTLSLGLRQEHLTVMVFRAFHVDGRPVRSGGGMVVRTQNKKHSESPRRCEVPAHSPVVVGTAGGCWLD
jgi:hypothetical protein